MQNQTTSKQDLKKLQKEVHYWIKQDYRTGMYYEEIEKTIIDLTKAAHESGKQEEREKIDEDIEALRHFHDTTIGLLATDKTYYDLRIIIYEAIEAAFEMSGIGKPTADVSLPVILAAQGKLKKIMWMISPIKVKALSTSKEKNNE